MDAFSADMLTKLSDELLAIRDSLTVSYPSLDLSRVQTIDASIIDGYGDQVVDASSMLTVFRTNSAYAKIATPVKEVNGGFVPDPTTRLFTDDVPFGLCILKDLALRLKIKTPGIDIVLSWMRTLMGQEYFVNGELRGKHMNECGILGNYGFLNDVDDVIAFAT